MSHRGSTRSGRPAGIDLPLVLALGCLVGLLVLVRAGLEVGPTLVLLAAAGIVGGVTGAVTRVADPRHGLVLLVVMIAPTVALGRWAPGAYGIVWFLASGAAAVAGRSYRKQSSRRDGRRSGRSTPDTGVQ